MDSQSGAPSTGAKDGNHKRDRMRRSVPATRRDRLLRWRKMTINAAAMAPTTTGFGTFPATAATGSATAPAIDPAEMNLVTTIVAIKTSAAITVANGASTAKTPAD